MTSYRSTLVFAILQAFLCDWISYGYYLSEYAEEDHSVDELIVNAANSTKEFEFFYDNQRKLVKSEYDIVYSMDEWNDRRRRRKRTAGVKVGHNDAKRWTNAIIPFKYNEGDFSDQEKAIIKSGMDEWARHTCLTFRKSDQDENKIVFKDAGGCFSRVGMVGGEQVVGMAKNCRFKGVVLHEVGHAIGLHHEQTRPDRDQHVKILFNNIPEPLKFNFEKYTWEDIHDLSIPYDYSSIMHYGKNAFSSNGKPTIVTLKDEMRNTIGQKLGLSFRDIKTVSILYNCKNASTGCTKEDSSCPGEGFVGKDCQCWCPGSPIQLCSQGGGDTDGGGEAIAEKKEKKTEEKACEDQHKSCSYWAGIGECKKNPAYMLFYCKASCKVCTASAEKSKTSPSSETSSSCKDTDALCPSWAMRGECDKNPLYMKVNCKKSCKVCGGDGAKKKQTSVPAQHYGWNSPACVDYNGMCGVWAYNRQCTFNPAFMHTSCRKSCKLC